MISTWRLAFFFFFTKGADACVWVVQEVTVDVVMIVEVEAGPVTDGAITVAAVTVASM